MRVFLFEKENEKIQYIYSENNLICDVLGKQERYELNGEKLCICSEIYLNL